MAHMVKINQLDFEAVPHAPCSQTWLRRTLAHCLN